MIEAVLFDGDQTLWDFERVMRDALIAVAGRAAGGPARCRSPSALALARTSSATGPRSAIELEGVEYNLARLRVLGFARTLERTAGDGRDDGDADADADAALTEELAASYFAHRDRDPALFPDTVPCLEALRPRYRLGLLSNGSRLPEKVGLGHFFESVVFAQDHRVAKPDKGIFEIVERQLGCRPQRLRARRRPPDQRCGRRQARRLGRRLDRPRWRRAPSAARLTSRTISTGSPTRSSAR